MASVTSLGFNIFSKWSGKGVRNAVKDVDSFSGRMQAAGGRIMGVGQTLSTAVSAPLAGIGVTALKMGGDFEQAMQKVAAVSGATGSEIGRLEDLAKELGSTTQFSASEAAEGMQLLSMAGFDAAETTEALPGVLNLASAGAVELGTAADIASNVLSGYGMEASEVGAVNDVLAKTFTSTNTDLNMLGESFKMVAPIASGAGLEFEEVSAAVGTLGDAGIQGSEAGTALRGAIARLLNPTAQVSGALSELGVSVTDSSGQLLPLVDIVGNLESAGADTADIMTIFGQEAGPAMQALVSQGAGALDELTGNLKNAGGTADDIASTQMEGFNGSIKELKSAFEGLMIAVSESGLLGWVTKIVGKVTEWTQALSQSNPWLLKIGVVIGVIAAVIGPLVLAVGAFVAAIGAIAGVMTPVVGVVAAVVAGIVALGAAVVAAWKHSETFRGVVMGAWNGIKSGWNALWNGALKPGFTALQQWWSEMWPKIKSVAMDAWNAVTDTIERLKPKVMKIFGQIQEIVSGVTGFITGLWEDHGDKVMGVVDFLMTTVGGIFKGAFKIIGGIVSGAWDIISGIFSGAFDVIGGILDFFIGLFTGDWQRMWDGIKGIFNGVWTAIKGIFNGLVTALGGIIDGLISAITAPFKWLWNWLVGNSLIPDMVNGVIDWFKSLRDKAAALWTKIKNWIVLRVRILYLKALLFVLRIRNGIIQRFTALRDKALEIWTKIKTWILRRVEVLRRRAIRLALKIRYGIISRFIALRNKAREIWNKIRDWITSRAEGLRDRVRDTVQNLKDKVIDAFERAKDGVERAWDKLKDVAKAPVRFVVETVYNEGIRDLWNKVADKVPGLSDLPKMRLPSGFAEGGILPGRSSWRGGDTHLRPMREGEGVYVSEVMADPYERARLHAMNRAAMAGGQSAMDRVRSRLDFGGNPRTGAVEDRSQLGFARGGILGRISGWVGNTWQDIVGGLKGWVKKPLNMLRDSLAGEFGRGKNWRTIPLQMLKAWREKIMSRFQDEDEMGAGGRAAFGSLDDVSAGLRRAARHVQSTVGRPYQWGGGGPRWDCSGYMASIQKAIMNRNPPGHYGRLYSTHSFRGGSPAGWRRGLRSPFTVGVQHGGRSTAHMAGTLMGVNVESRGSRGTLSGTAARGTASFPHRFGFAPVADSGAELQPGLNLLDNRTGRAEPLANTDLAAREGGARELHLHFHGPVSSRRQAEDLIVQGLSDAERKGRVVKGTVRPR